MSEEATAAPFKIVLFTVEADNEEGLEPGTWFGVEPNDESVEEIQVFGPYGNEDDLKADVMLFLTGTLGDQAFIDSVDIEDAR